MPPPGPKSMKITTTAPKTRRTPIQPWSPIRIRAELASLVFADHPKRPRSRKNTIVEKRFHTLRIFHRLYTTQAALLIPLRRIFTPAWFQIGDETFSDHLIGSEVSPSYIVSVPANIPELSSPSQ
ncbi:hypothetical protein H257_09780 [Aphanomyces astaci]|uniref:Uncharacterized protein n=1 Tax=Aphanomyces astaci TaxID=112090 RepID=W4G9F9_APHAT|nr:hypothetical protein H257_09780 [Aphanomyces astaci]ETV76315.1 hypothetical protein H257_09780 [Aphanomyces astaci]|eukprot:XP_009834440.1 hypothetical protein H257_09780 [Aphanomyces astaci]